MGTRSAEGRCAPTSESVIPPPEVPCRPASWQEVPRSAQGVATAAKTAGWYVRCTYARGPLLGADGRALRVVDSVAVRMHTALSRAVGVWETDARGVYGYSSGYLWQAGMRTWPRRVGYRELKEATSRLAEADYSLDMGD